MADELTINLKVRFQSADGHTDLTWNPAIDLAVDVTGSAHLWTKQSVGLTEEVLAQADLTDGGMILMVNRDPTNFILIRRGTGDNDFLQLLPGDVQLIRIYANEITPYVIADTAACELEYLWLDL